MKALLATAIAAIFSLFGIHQAPAHTVRTPPSAQVAAAVTAVGDPFHAVSNDPGASTRQSTTIDSIPSPQRTIVKQPARLNDVSRSGGSITQPARTEPVERVAEKIIQSAPFASGRVLGASTDDTAAKLADLQNQINALANLPRSVFVPSFSGPAATTPVSTATFAQSSRIDQLSGTSLSNITVDGVSGLTAADIPALAYLPATGGTLSGTINASGFNVNGAPYVDNSSTDDPNSLIVGDISRPEWNSYWVSAGYAPVKIAPAYDALDSFADGVFVNRDGNAPTNGMMSVIFVPPAGTNSVTFNVPAKLPSGVSNSTISLELWQVSPQTKLVANHVTLTSTVTTYQVSSAVTPGTEYMAVIAVNESEAQSQAQAIIGRVSVVPTGANGMFNSNYLRYYVSPRILQDNTYASSTDRYYLSNVFSHVDFITDATSTLVEYVATWASSELAVLVNGRPYQYVTASSGGVVQQTTVALPAGRKTVERAGLVCLNNFSASISGASAGVRLPSGVAAG